MHVVIYQQYERTKTYPILVHSSKGCVIVEMIGDEVNIHNAQHGYIHESYLHNHKEMNYE